jgi:hypothetical protein
MTGDELRQIALGLPETTEKLTWEVDITFRVRDKIFVVMGPDGGGATVKASVEAQQALVASDPETFSVAAYTGRLGWTSVNLARVDPDKMRELVEEAWRRTAPRKLVAAFDQRSAAVFRPES